MKRLTKWIAAAVITCGLAWLLAAQAQAQVVVYRPIVTSPAPNERALTVLRPKWLPPSARPGGSSNWFHGRPPRDVRTSTKLR